MDIRDACREMFQRHRVEAFGGVFHVPDVDQYNCLFAWDSGYHALALRHLDPNLAEAELATLYRANTADDGLLAHERPAPGSEERTSLVTEALGPIYRSDGKSWLIDPPAPAYAAAKLFKPGDAVNLLKAASAHLDAIDRLRVIEAGGLPVILHPLESGTDASPQFDGLVDASSGQAILMNFYALSHRIAGFGYSVERAMAGAYPFVVSDVVFCGWHLLAHEALAQAWARAGDAARAAKHEARAKELARLMARDMWSDAHALFVGYDHVGKRALSTPTLGGVIPAASSNAAALGLAARTMASHLSDGAPFWGEAGISFNPVSKQPVSFEGMLWRGDVASGATHYWAHMAFMAAADRAAAARAREQLEGLIRSTGFREFYDANSGAGVGAGATAGFTWPALVLDMIED